MQIKSRYLMIVRKHLPGMHYWIVEEKNMYSMIMSKTVMLIDQILCCETKGRSGQA